MEFAHTKKVSSCIARALFKACAVACAMSVGACVLNSAYAEASSKGVPATANSAPDYNTDIAELFANGGCSSIKCHAAVSGAGGLKLSLFFGDNRADYSNILEAYKGRLLNFNRPAKSLLLRKVSGQVAHAGGVFFKPDSAQYALLKTWIESGAPFELDGKIKPVALNTPHEVVVMEVGGVVKPSFELKMSDGSSVDISSKVRLSPAESGVVEIQKDGSLKALKSGQTLLNASYLRNFKTLNIMVPSGRTVKIDEPMGSEVDLYVNSKLETMGIEPSKLCSDSEFLKRVYLDTTGFLPPADVAEKFLVSADPKKRSRLIDAILASEEFVDWYILNLGDTLRIKSEFPSNLWPNAVQAYGTWLRNCALEDMPFDVMTRDILTSTGTNFRQPQVNFFRAVNEKRPDNYAEAAALVFMGMRLNCVKCHAHPYENWDRCDAEKFFAFFAKVKFKTTKEWKEEILCVDSEAKFKNSDGEVVQPEFITGQKPQIQDGQDPREAFAMWLTSPQNPYFARAFVNRLWCRLMSRGIIEPADDIRPNNLPLNPELLEFLEAEFLKSSYNPKRIYSLILNSNAYQRSCVSNASNASDSKYFSHRMPVRLCAESINDILQIATGKSEQFKSIIPEPYSFWPEGFRAGQLMDGSVGNTMLSLFGKPPRNSSYLNDRECTLTMPQVLYMASSADVDGKIQSSQILSGLEKAKIPPAEKVRKVYLAFLSRFPTDAEMKIALKYLSDNKAQGALKDIAWALANTKEFMFKF